MAAMFCAARQLAACAVAAAAYMPGARTKETAMTAANLAGPIATGAPAPERRADPWGLAAGWRGWQEWSRLAAMTDAELAAEGLTRAEAPRAALAALKTGL
jgi:hypothetical protein